jgi:hypothetical protein
MIIFLFFESRDHVGSSASNNFVFHTKALAIATLWDSHQLKLKAYTSFFDLSQTISSISSVVKFLVCLFSSIIKSMFSQTVRFSINLKF